MNSFCYFISLLALFSLIYRFSSLYRLSYFQTYHFPLPFMSLLNFWLSSALPSSRLVILPTVSYAIPSLSSLFSCLMTKLFHPPALFLLHSSIIFTPGYSSLSFLYYTLLPHLIWLYPAPFPLSLLFLSLSHSFTSFLLLLSFSLLFYALSPFSFLFFFFPFSRSPPSPSLPLFVHLSFLIFLFLLPSPISPSSLSRLLPLSPQPDWFHTPLNTSWFIREAGPNQSCNYCSKYTEGDVCRRKILGSRRMLEEKENNDEDSAYCEKRWRRNKRETDRIWVNTEKKKNWRGREIVIVNMAENHARKIRLMIKAFKIVIAKVLKHI